MQVFISYVHEDRERAISLYELLHAHGFAPWLDLRSMLGGQNWRRAIAHAIRMSSAFIPVLSSFSVSKRGYFQAELKYAFETLHTFPEDHVFIIPVRFDDCPIPERLSDLHCIRYWNNLNDPEIVAAVRAAQLQQAPRIASAHAVLDHYIPADSASRDLLAGVGHSLIQSTNRNIHATPEQRSRFIYALRGLFSALTACHDAYCKYTKNEKYADMKDAWAYHGPDWSSIRRYARALGHELEPLRTDWLRSVDRLVEAIWSRRDVLQIFDPGLYELLDSYSAGEANAYLNDLYTDEARIEKLRQYLQRREYDASKDSPSFENVCGSLRQFIVENTEISEFF